MQVTLLSAYASGGAGTAKTRIHRELRRIGVESTVDHKEGDDPDVTAPDRALRTAWMMARPFIDRAPLRLYGGSDGVFSPGWLPDSSPSRVDALDPDVFHFNWIGGGFLDAGSVSEFDRPIVWRPPDMWAFTSGCRYAGDCERYRESCGRCPQLGSRLSWDLSRLTWRRKAGRTPRPLTYATDFPSQLFKQFS